ncbi:MAG: ABC transporter substrate-binding protein, partial [Lachnospiraceae bacterium]|nr:ABC transporter substrate-binding protein [Lachnospiraceae bacterium]
MKLKRLLAAGVAAVMLLGTLAGCGNSGSSPASSDGGSEGSSQSAQADSGEIVPLKWVIIGNGMPRNYDTWIAKVNEYI